MDLTFSVARNASAKFGTLKLLAGGQMSIINLHNPHNLDNGFVIVVIVGASLYLLVRNPHYNREGAILQMVGSFNRARSRGRIPRDGPCTRRDDC